MLVLQQSWPEETESKAGSSKEGLPEFSPQKGGRGSWRGSLAGCHLCNPAKAVAFQSRKAQAQALLDPASWPEMKPGSWTVRYYDPLPMPSISCRKAARRILRHFHQLGWPQEVPPGEPGLRQQDSVSCGLYCLHWAEAILREFREKAPLPRLSYQETGSRL